MVTVRVRAFHCVVLMSRVIVCRGEELVGRLAGGRRMNVKDKTRPS